MFLSFHDNRKEKKKIVVSQIYLQSGKKKNKNLGDIKCVEVKRVFCKKKKNEKKTHLKKKRN